MYIFGFENVPRNIRGKHYGFIGRDLLKIAEGDVIESERRANDMEVTIYHFHKN